MEEEKDVEFEPDLPAQAGHDDTADDMHDAVHKINKLKDELEKIKKEKQEYLDGWQRAKADYVNILKRSEG